MANAFARVNDPNTSKLAASSVSGRSSNLEKSVLHHLRLCGAMTTHELSSKSGISLQSLTPRMRPLETRGLIERRGVKIHVGDSGRKRQLTLWASK